MTFRPQLWDLMKRAAGNPDALAALLAPATAEQLILLQHRFEDAVDALTREPAFAAHAEPGGAPALASWVVTQGRKVWFDAQRDPAALPRRAPPDALDVPGVIARVYRDRFGGALPDEEPALPGDLAAQPGDEDELWDLVEITNAGVPMADALSARTRSEIARLGLALDRVFDRLNERAQVLGEDPTGTGWMSWTDWVIGQGKAAYERTLAQPEAAPREPPEDVEYFGAKLRDVYHQRYGERI
jgi:hypothetical protein